MTPEKWERIKKIFYSVSELDGQVIGSYRIESEIGRGGMGAVYLASRADDEFDKKAAIKLIKRGFDTDEIIKRFRHERQILAALEHPNITRLLDGGSTNDGLPYLVMDYVDGTPLGDFSNTQKLSINQRLEIFLQICDAVSYAHKNLVIHRDLKPSNILVTADGIPKLLDFGIAKLVIHNSDLKTIEKTFNAFQAMTPEYASPEQISGRPVTTSTDIYSLGVVLFELLTGHRPYHFETRNVEDINRIFTDILPTKPSSVCRSHGIKLSLEDPSSVIGILQGDIDNIVLMAMRNEAERRYSSVEQFAEDIRRHLAGLTVLAREDTLSYRTSKFIKRNKAGVAAGVGIAASLFGGLIATSQMAKRASRQRDRARYERNRSENINQFLRKMLASSDPRKQGKDVKLTEILEIAAVSIDKDFVHQPDIVADLQSTIGLTLISQGKLDKAEAPLAKALKIRIELYGEHNADTAISQHNFGQLLEARGEAPEAELFYRRSLRTLRLHFGRDDLRVANVLHDLSHVLSLQGEDGKGIKILREVLRIRKAKLDEDHPDIAKALTELGSAITMVGDPESAEPLQRQALAIALKNYGSNHPDTAAIMLNLFGAIQHKDPVESEWLVTEALRVRRKFLGDDHPEVAWAIYHLSFLKFNQGYTIESNNMLREILRMRGTTLFDENLLVSNTLSLLGRSLIAQNDFSEAEDVLRECLELRERYLAPDNWLLATTNGFLGECLMEQGKTETGKRLLIESYTFLNTKLGESHMHTKLALNRLNQYLAQ